MSSESTFNPDNSIYAEYFRLTDYFLKKYGPNTILMLQVGAFFEMYATKDIKTGIITRSRVEEVSAICGGLTISDKKYTHGTQLVVMAGFRDYNVDRYIQFAVDANFTVVVYTQKELAPGKMTREHTGTYSPGTFLPSDTDTTTKMMNNVLCLWIDKFTPLKNASFKRASSQQTLKPNLVCGASIVNIFTGESTMFEYETAMVMVPATFDALERFVSTHAPSETIFVTPFPDLADSKRVLQYIGVTSRVVHFVQQESSEDVDEDAKMIVERCRQQKYVRHILSSFFREDTYDVCEEFRNYVVGTQSYCYLLNFIQERNPNLVRKIALPKFDNQTTNMILANHTLRQLNIIDDFVLTDDSPSSHLRSVGAFLNKCCSAVGRRRFLHQITHPTFDEAWLNREYGAIGKMMESYEMVDAFRKLIREVADLEKIARQLVSRKLNPDSIARLYKSILAIQQIHVCLLESDELCLYFLSASREEGKEGEEPNPHKIVQGWIESVLSCISSNLIVERCQGCQSTSAFEDNIVKPGVCSELDTLIARMNENELLFQEIRRTFNAIMSKIEGNKSSSSDYVRVHETEKSGAFLHLTKRRSGILKKHLADLQKRDGGEATIVFSLGKSNISVRVVEITMTSAGASNDAIEFPLLDRIVREKLTIKDTINQTISKAYSQFLERLEQDCLPTLENLANFLARVDVLQSKTYAAKTYGYCRPTIGSQPKSEISYVEARELRHCLIEHIQTQELYVTNDVCLSTDLKTPSGILLYGTNAVGKTSLIRALGIALIMAQSGMYVPCSAFTYRPYRAIFTRILGNDNLFKNLSMFAVEMSELRVILNAADEYSLVLGDELCSGTETESALSIFVSGLTELHRTKSTFLFATHFHEILKFDEIRDLERIAVKHMAVHYDRELDCLVYDRVLRDGPGNRLYGLEVAKSLHLPEEFLERAYKIRNKYFPDMRGDLSASPTKYNATKLRSMCEICKSEWADETHHLQEQHLADADGRIGSINVNHPANLMALCEKCHLVMHQSAAEVKQHSSSSASLEKPKVIRKKTTVGYTIATTKR